MAKGKGGNVVGMVESIVRSVVEELGYRLWDVRYEKEGPDWFLRVFIDKDGDMTTADCEVVSRAVDPLIDEADPIVESYFFEVSSPGLGRRLTKPEHFVAVCGEKINLRLYRADASGQKEYTGLLQRAENDCIVLETEQGEQTIALADLSFAKLCDDEDLFSNIEK